MFLTTHAIVGVVLGQTQPTFVRGLLLSLASHYVLDAIPHSEHQPYDAVIKFVHDPRGSEARRLLPLFIFDGLLGVVVPFFIFPPLNAYDAFINFCFIGVAMLPDALMGLYVYAGGFFHLHYQFHQFFHFLILKRHWLQDHIVIGLLLQVVFGILAVYLFRL